MTTLKTLCFTLATLISVPAFSTDAPSTGLGEPWPNATDVSLNANWHVYVFERRGTEYIQVNDSTGQIRGAVAKTPYSVIGLPMGRDAERVSTPEQPLLVPDVQWTKIYENTGVKVFVAPQTNGAARIMAVPGECKDPIECSKSIQ